MWPKIDRGSRRQRSSFNAGLGAAAAAVALVATACSPNAGEDAAREADIILTEFAIDPAPLVVATGDTVTFVVKNEGGIFHELRFSNAERVAEHLAEIHDGEGSEHEEDAPSDDIVIELESGESGQVTVTLDPTVFTEVVCLVPGHYEAGMRTNLEYAQT